MQNSRRRAISHLDVFIYSFLFLIYSLFAISHLDVGLRRDVSVAEGGESESGPVEGAEVDDVPLREFRLEAVERLGVSRQPRPLTTRLAVKT